jgi:hypothetical protein
MSPAGSPAGDDGVVSGWTVVGAPPPPGATAMSLGGFLAVLDGLRERLVPFVGAGLAADAGAPSSATLTEALLAAAGEADDPDAQLFAVSDRLAATHGERWVQQTVADVVGRRPLRPTPALMALAKTASGLVITTNYDEAVEVSAAEVGREVVATTLRDFRGVLDPPTNTLVVLHLHGLAVEPDSIVLTEDSYARIRTDEVAQLLLRARGMAGRFLFVGHSLDEREAHIRRDVEWTTTAGVPQGEQRHLMVMSVTDVADAAPRAQALADDLGLRVFVHQDPHRGFRAVRLAAAVAAGRSAVREEDMAETLAPPDAHYVPHAVAPAEDLATPEARGRLLARTWQHGAQLAPDLDASTTRLLLVAGPGYGKSRELREIAARADRPALYLRLGGVTPLPHGVPVDVAFRSWMEQASAVQGNPSPRLTETRMRDESFVLLLDGLDEVAAALRPEVVAVLRAVVAAYPHHRWVIATRPVAEVGHFTDDFDHQTFAPDPSWVSRYAAGRGLDPASVDQYLSATPGVADLMEIPVFAVSVVDELTAGNEPPRTALELVLRLADARVQRDLRPLARPEALTSWLDRLALALELQGQTSIGVAALADTDLHAGLDLVPTPQFIGELALRSLVTDAAGVVAFPANIVQEARAARAVLQAGEAGQALLQSHVLIRLPPSRLGGAAVTGVRPDWLNTLELLLGAAEPSWRALVAQYDAVPAARATPSDAPERERHEAVTMLWTTYRQRRVWLSRGASGDERDDAGALRRLVAAGPPPKFVEELTAALSDPERTVRANALLVLAAVLPDSTLHEHVTRAITDPEPVVRRQAASVAVEHGFRDLSDLLARQAATDTDELARQTLCEFAIALADSDVRAVELARTLPTHLAERAWHEVARRVPRDRLLDLLAGPPPEPGLLEVLIDDTRIHQDPWTAQQVYALSTLLAKLPEEDAHHNGVEAVLTSHPLAALAGRLTAAPRPDGAYDLWRLVQALPDTQLTDTLSSLEADGAALAAAAGVSTTGPLDAATLELAQELLRQRMTPVTAPPLTAPRPSHAERRRQRVRAATTNVLDDTALDVLLAEPPSALETELDPQQQMRLTARVDEEVAAVIDGGALLRYAEQAQPTVPVRTVGALAWAAHLHRPIRPDRWPTVAMFLLRWRDERLAAWCRDNADSAAVEELLRRVAGRDPALGANAHTVVPQPWPVPLVETVLDAALQLAANGEPAAQTAAAGAAAALLGGGAADAVRASLPRPCPSWLLPYAVRLGDCEAERELLAGLLADPDGIPRWPLERATDWIPSISCGTSAELLEAVLRAALRRGREPHDLSALFNALNRICSVDVLSRYDALIADPVIPAASFLYYQRQAALAALLDGASRAELTSSAPFRLACELVQA